MSGEFFGVIHLPTYLLGTLIIILLPGPNSLFVLSTAAGRGIRTGYLAACGVFAGDTVLMVLAAGGAASVLAAFPPLFMVFKLAGAAYLAYLGFGMLRGAWRERTAPSQQEGEEPAAPSAAAMAHPFKRALLISLMNPKAILFFVAFFIQFVDRSYAHTALSFAVLGAIVQAMSFVYLSALIFSGARLADAFRRRRKLAAGLTGAAGTLFLGFSARLATATVG